MKGKISALFICTLLIATAVPALGSLYNGEIPKEEQSVRSYISGQGFYQEKKLHASNGVVNDEFGYSVALDGDRALLGAPNEGATGSAYEFNHTSTMPQQHEINASDRANGDLFGWSVSINSSFALVGAPNHNACGSAYVFTRNADGTLKEVQELQASIPSTGDEFGISVSINASMALIGASGKDASQGAVYVFKWDGGSWIQKQILTASNPVAGDNFGISISQQKNTVIMGAPGKNENGSAYIFTYRADSTWKQQQELNASNTVDGDQFGCSVALDLTNVLIGACGFNSDTGTAYVFTYRMVDGTWRQLQELNASDQLPNNNFGDSVSLGGGTALIGATLRDDSKGAAYLFFFNLMTWTWTEKQILTADPAPGDNFGINVCIKGDIALIGAAFDDDMGDSSGSAYVFLRDIEEPIVSITDPVNGIYLWDWKPSLPLLHFTVIIGGVTIKATASDAQTGIKKVEFYDTGSLLGTDTTSPFELSWPRRPPFQIFTMHLISAIAYDNASNFAGSTVISVWRLFSS
jgi:hypothetical protein